ncbi:NYN domain-containing protein, partial [Escherichia coli]|nr:NYN domain-containing protein [Escherichia coli]
MSILDPAATKPKYATAQIAVWWDMNDCPIPEGYDARRVRPSIEGAFKKLGYSGPVSITAYGDQTQTSDDILRGLS